MRVLITAMALFNYIQSYSQVLPNAKAWENTYTTMNIYDTTASGHIVTCFFIMQYDTTNDMSLNMRVGRIDLNTQDTITKEINAPSSSSAFWMYLMDSVGNFYISFNTSGRSIWLVNLRDSLYIDSVGKPFLDENTLTYSMAIGTDRKIYMGGSSGGTYVSVYDPLAKTFTKFGEVLTNQDYVLGVTGDSEWIYAQVGQRSYNYIVAIRKSDGYKKKIDSVPSSTRFDLKTRNDNRININGIHGRYILKDTTLTLIPVGQSYTGTDEIYYKNVWVGTTVPTPKGKKRVDPYFNEATNVYSYTSNTGLNNSITLNSIFIRANIRFVIPHPSDPNRLLYNGDYYGSWYDYFINEDSAVVIGKGIGNVYSYARVNDSIIALGCYPSGQVGIWNINQAWTVGVYDSITQSVGTFGGKGVSNPYILTYFKNVDNAGMSHVNQLLYDSTTNYLVGFGDVIRVGDGFSIAAVNWITGEAHGIDFNRFPVGITFRNISFYQKNQVAISTSKDTSSAKIWVYNFIINELVDSVKLSGFSNYGRVYSVGSLLVCVANNRFYKINMALDKKLIYDSIIGGTGYFNTMLPDGSIGYNGWYQPPNDFWRITYLGNNGNMSNYVGVIGDYYTHYGRDIIKTVNVVDRIINLETVEGKEAFIKRKLIGQ
jgi:hypothetical protein